MTNILLILLIHFAVTCYMTGVIWFVQLIQYPSFDQIPKNEFPRYHQKYTKLMGRVVGPAMVIEVLTGTLLSSLLIDDNIAAIHLNMALLFVIWISTFALQVPCHSKLSKCYDRVVLEKLVLSNWIRTLAWTCRSILLFLYILRVLEIA